MELVATCGPGGRGSQMAAVTQVCALDDVAKMLGEDLALLEAIV